MALRSGADLISTDCASVGAAHVKYRLAGLAQQGAVEYHHVG
jgi:hypothetical protein